MIILSYEGKGLIHIEHWEDIQSRPGFLWELDPKSHTLSAIIGRYALRYKIRCGLSNCHTPHAKGYIVVTKNGHETNIGKDCGRKYFSVDFDTLSAKFDRDITEKENREKLWNFSSGLNELKDKILSIRKQNGADWVHRMSRELVEPSNKFPAEIFQRINSMVKTRETSLFTDREATAKEVENLEATHGRKFPRPHYIQEHIAEIAGLDALQPENNLRNLLVFELEEQIKHFEAEDIDLMNFETLHRWVKWVEGVEANLNRAIKAVKSGRRLLTQENLSPFSKIIRNADDISLFKKYLKSLKHETE